MRTHHVLPDGSVIVLRPLEPDDAALVGEVFEGLGPASRQRRFLVPKNRLSESDLRLLTAVDHWHHEAFVALSATDGRAVGIGRFVRDVQDRGTADMAVTVVDSWQVHGVGSILTDVLAARARELGVRRFSVVMTTDNRGAARLMDRLPGDRGPALTSSGTTEYVVELAAAG